MIWILAIAFAIYFVVFQAAEEAWLRRLRGCGAKPAACGLAGHEVARRLIERHGHGRITVARARGARGSGFDRRRNRVLLDKSVHDGNSLAAMCLAAIAVAQAIPSESGCDEATGRRFVTGFLHPAIGATILLVLVASIFRPTLLKAVFFVWLLGGLVLLVGHATTLAAEYKLVARALRMLEEDGLIARTERDDVETLRKGLALREVKGVGHAIRRLLGAILPLRGW